MPPHVRSGERLDRPPYAEPMYRGMGRDAVKNQRQNLPLQSLQPWLGRFDQTNAAGSFRQDPVMKVPQFRAIFPAVSQSSEIGEPLQFPWSEQKPIGQRRRGFDGG